MPTFAHYAAVQISDEPIEYRSLHSLMEKMTEDVLTALSGLTEAIGEEYPDAADVPPAEYEQAFYASHRTDHDRAGIPS